VAASVTLTELLGAAVVDSTGSTAGRVHEIALCPQEDPVHVSAMVVRTKDGDRLVSAASLVAANGEVQVALPQSQWVQYAGSEGLLLLGRDLLDQQVIDVYGRKVVRVNDIVLLEQAFDNHLVLKVGLVDVGARGAVRRLLKGLVPAQSLRKFLQRIPEKPIPWEFVDLIETDPARRVKLKISHERLAKLHPADIADIIEDLAPAEAQAVIETLSEEVAAEALEELDPKVQASILRSLDSDRAADIVEEMDPDAAADALADLPPETSENILDEMEPEHREDVEELLEYRDDTAAGRMNTDYLALGPSATVHDAIETLRQFEGGIESLNTVFLLDPDAKLLGAVSLPKIVLAQPEQPLLSLAGGQVISVHTDAHEKEIAELFDKYNLLTLPVVDEDGRVAGVITADDVISMLRSKL
jgi:magnesium transporter